MLKEGVNIALSYIPNFLDTQELWMMLDTECTTQEPLQRIWLVLSPWELILMQG